MRGGELPESSRLHRGDKTLRYRMRLQEPLPIMFHAFGAATGSSNVAAVSLVLISESYFRATVSSQIDFSIEYRRPRAPGLPAPTVSTHWRGSGVSSRGAGAEVETEADALRVALLSPTTLTAYSPISAANATKANAQLIPIIIRLARTRYETTSSPAPAPIAAIFTFAAQRGGAQIPRALVKTSTRRVPRRLEGAVRSGDEGVLCRGGGGVPELNAAGTFPEELQEDGGPPARRPWFLQTQGYCSRPSTLDSPNHGVSSPQVFLMTPAGARSSGTHHSTRTIQDGLGLHHSIPKRQLCSCLVGWDGRFQLQKCYNSLPTYISIFHKT
ncbi:hypothetical protein B0H12DRAFT_1218003 [Mycena haematopus]|nr:hypothetical protein B0H12DRAFT_1218003 [Mycena haematopus]